MAALTLRACAKVNLSLYVTGKRSDGMHELVSTFASVDLADEIQFTVNDGSLVRPELHMITDCPLIRGQCIPLDDNNLILKADRDWRLAQGSSLQSVTYRLTKNIPSLSGLGGGSADCAAVLLGLNSLAKTHFSIPPLGLNSLDELALKLGADVPFCLKGGFALGEGVGEKLSPLAAINSTFHVLLVRPLQGVDTGSAFREIDESNDTGLSSDEAALRCRKLANHLSEGSLLQVAPLIHNDFLKPFIDKSINNKRLYEQIHEMSSGACGLSGSGSVLFALFSDFNELLRVKKILSTVPTVSWITETVFVSEGVRII